VKATERLCISIINFIGFALPLDLTVNLVWPLQFVSKKDFALGEWAIKILGVENPLVHPLLRITIS